MLENGTIHPVLPASYGESTSLPGIPHQSCVAPLSFHPNEPGSISAFVIASSQDVFILGPNLERPLSRTTRHLWRPHFEIYSDEKLSSTVFSPSLVQYPDPATNQHRVGSSEGVMRIVAITAFLLYSSGSSGERAAKEKLKASLVDNSSQEPIVDEKTKDKKGVQCSPISPSSFLRNSSEISDPNISSKYSLPFDTVCIVVAWADSSAVYHLTALFVALRHALAPSCHNFLLYEKEIPLGLPSDVHVVRIFYHSNFCALNTDNASSSPNFQCLPRHVLCISLSQQPLKGSKTALGSGCLTGSSTGIAKRLGKIIFIVIREVLLPDASYLLPSPASRRKNDGISSSTNAFTLSTLKELLVVWKMPKNSQLEIGIPTELDIANFLIHLTSIKSIVSCLEVLPLQATVECEMADLLHCSSKLISDNGNDYRAAVGTMDGRVFLLSAAAITLARRVSGPVADIKVVVPSAWSFGASLHSYDRKKKVLEASEERRVEIENIKTKKDNQELKHNRLPQIDALLSSAKPLHRKNRRVFLRKKSCLFRFSDASSEQPKEVHLDITLVILDAIGKIVLLRRINRSCSSVQTVTDVPHMATLLKRCEKENVSSFQLAVSKEGNGTETSRSEPFEGFLGHALSTDNLAPNNHKMVTGHILSSGLLHAAIRYHPLQLIVSTMSRGIVILPYHPEKDQFSISSYTLYPTPVLYVGVADVFATGAEDLLLAGLDSVLIARQHQNIQRRNAFTLLRLLNEKSGSNALST